MPTTSSPVKTTSAVAAAAIPKPMLFAPRFPLPQVQASTVPAPQVQASTVPAPEIQTSTVPEVQAPEIQESRVEKGKYYMLLFYYHLSVKCEIIFTNLFSSKEEKNKSRTSSSRNEKTSWNFV